MNRRWYTLAPAVVISLLVANVVTAAAQDGTTLSGEQLTPAQRFVEVQTLRRHGDLAEALAELDDLRSDYPNDVDYALARAQVLAGLERNDEALEELREATRLAPDYEDIWKLRDRLLGLQNAADERLALRKDAALRFPDSGWWRSQPPTDPHRWLLLLGAGYNDLSNGLPGWNNEFVELQFQHDSSHQYRLFVARDARYSSVDTTIGLGAETSWDPGWFAGVEVSSASSPEYLPELGFSGHVGKALHAGWVLDLRYQHRDYVTADLGGWIGTVEKYAGEFRYAYSLGRSRLDGASGFTSHRLALDWYYRDDASVGITISGGDEAESLGDGRVLETRVKGITFNGHRSVSQRVDLRWWLGVSEQGNFYRRRFLGLAVAVRL